MILSYLAPFHKIISLLRRLSRTCFIMSFGSKQVLKHLEHKTVTLPLVSPRSLIVQPQADHASFSLGFKVSFRNKETLPGVPQEAFSLPSDCANEATQLSLAN